MAKVKRELLTPNERKWVDQLLQAVRNLPRSLYISLDEDIWDGTKGSVLVFKRDKKEPWNKSRRVAEIRKGSALENYRPEGAE